MGIAAGRGFRIGLDRSAFSFEDLQEDTPARDLVQKSCIAMCASLVDQGCNKSGAGE